MRIKELTDIHQLLDIKEDETYIWKMDYSITEMYKRIVNDEGYFLRVEYPYTIIKIYNEKLLKEINKEFNLSLVLNENIKINNQEGKDIKLFINSLRDKDWKLSGSIGTESLEELED